MDPGTRKVQSDRGHCILVDFGPAEWGLNAICDYLFLAKGLEILHQCTTKRGGCNPLMAAPVRKNADIARCSG